MSFDGLLGTRNAALTRSPKKNSQRTAVVACPAAQSDSCAFVAFVFKEFWDIQAARNPGRSRMVDRGLDAPGFWRRELREHVRIQPSGVPGSSPPGRAVLAFGGLLGTRNAALTPSPKKQSERPAVVACPAAQSDSCAFVAFVSKNSGTSKPRRIPGIRGTRVQESWNIQAAKNSKDSWHSCPKNVTPTREHQAGRSPELVNGLSNLEPCLTSTTRHRSSGMSGRAAEARGRARQSSECVHSPIATGQASVKSADDAYAGRVQQRQRKDHPERVDRRAARHLEHDDSAGALEKRDRVHQVTETSARGKHAALVIAAPPGKGEATSGGGRDVSRPLVYSLLKDSPPRRWRSTS